MELRWYQTEAVNAAWASIRNNQHPCIVLPTGAGKSLVIAELARQAVEKWHGRVLVLAHRKELLVQNAEKLARLLTGLNIGIYSAGLNRREWWHDVVCAGIQSAYKNADQFELRHLVIVDECFVEGTLISTPAGDVPIEEIQPGNFVHNATGIGQVLDTSARLVTQLVKLDFSDGTSITCTHNHPIFTGNGWTQAGAMGIGAIVYSVEAMHLLRQNVSAAEEKARWNHSHSERTPLDESILLLDLVFQDPRQLHEVSRDSGESQRKTQEDRSRAKGSWRQWQVGANAEISSHDTGRRLVDGVRSQDWIEESWVPASLQDRSGESGLNDSNRDRRWLPRVANEAKAGCTQIVVPGSKRLAAISNIASTGGRVVFNMHVSGHPSYFAGNTLVHNCHLIPHSEDGMYRKFLADMETMNPQVKVVGLTATPFRMDSGTITDGGILTDICYEASVSQLMREGWLSRVCNSATKQVDMSQVKKSRGEFVQQQMEETFLREVDANVTSALLCSNSRQSILWFCSGVAHCNRTAAAIEARTGERVGVVTGETLPIERQSLLHDFASRQLRHLVNCDVLTTGFDAPCIDAIVVLRATKSAGLFAQICGRGFRLHEGKEDCLILDFGGNINRHGPLDDPDYGRRRRVVREGSEEQGEIMGPQKLCERCEESIPASCVFCPECGHFMPRENKLQQEADTQSAILKEEVKPETVYVESVMMSRHWNRDNSKPPTLRVEYSVQLDGGGNLSTLVVCEWICICHEGFALRKAMQWWENHSISDFPQDDIDEAISLWRRGALRIPVRLSIVKEGRWWRIKDREFEDDRPEEWSDEIIGIEHDAEIEF